MLGRGLAQLPRDQIVVATKVGRYGAETFDFRQAMPGRRVWQAFLLAARPGTPPLLASSPWARQQLREAPWSACHVAAASHCGCATRGLQPPPGTGRHIDRVTSTPPRSAARVTASVRESLARLRLSYVDLIQCHDIEFTQLDQVGVRPLPSPA